MGPKCLPKSSLLISLHQARAGWTYGLAPRVSCPLASLLARPGPTRGRCRFQQPLLFTWVTQRPPSVLQAAAALESACLALRARYGEAPSTAPTSPCAWRRPSMRNGGMSFSELENHLTLAILPGNCRVGSLGYFLEVTQPEARAWLDVKSTTQKASERWAVA